MFPFILQPVCIIAEFMKYNFVTIEGNISAGKTTLAQANILMPPIFEDQTTILFCPGFAENPSQYAFPLELFFYGGTL